MATTRDQLTNAALEATRELYVLSACIAAYHRDLHAGQPAETSRKQLRDSLQVLLSNIATMLHYHRTVTRHTQHHGMELD